jgi:hypothetical protein
MGGLIARAVVEDQALDPGNVEQLILLGTPNAGSSLGGLRFALEAAHVLAPDCGDAEYAKALLHGWRRSLVDGLGEAGGDLLPGSVFLTKLAARPRNPDVAYHVVLGTRGVLAEARLRALRAHLPALLGDRALARLTEPMVDAFLAGLDEVVDGRGDGAVSVARGRLEGVEPVLVPRDHLGLVRLRGLVGAPVEAGEHPVFAQIAAWLAGS